MAYITEFPYKAWRLTPSFKPVEVEITGNNTGWNRRHKEVRASNGSNYQIGDLFESKALAIEDGRTSLRIQQELLNKRQATIDKKLAALAKAE